MRSSSCYIRIRYLTESNGQKFDNYVEWFLITYFFSLTTCPVPSLPAGFTPEGLPVGLQIIGAPYQDAKVLKIARMMEMLLDLPTGPIDPISGGRCGRGQHA